MCFGTGYDDESATDTHLESAFRAGDVQLVAESWSYPFDPLLFLIR